MKGFIAGFSLPLRALNLLLTRRRLKRFAILPLLANVLIYAVVYVLVIWALWNWDIAGPKWKFWGSTGETLSTAADGETGAVGRWQQAGPRQAVDVCHELRRHVFISQPERDLQTASRGVTFAVSRSGLAPLFHTHTTFVAVEFATATKMHT